MPMPNRDLIRASEIADWCFCRRSWYLSARGVGPSLVQIEKRHAGGDFHQQHARSVDQARGVMNGATRALLVAVVLAAAYCLLVEDVFRVSVPYGLVKYEDRTIRVEYTPSLRASMIALLDEIRTAKRNGECHINHNQPSKCRSCGFRSVCGEGLI